MTVLAKKFLLSILLISFIAACTNDYVPKNPNEVPTYFDNAEVKRTFQLTSPNGVVYESKRKLIGKRFHGYNAAFRRNRMMSIAPGIINMIVELEVREKDRDVLAASSKPVSFNAEEGEVYKLGLDESNWWISNSSNVKILNFPYKIR